METNPALVLRELKLEFDIFNGLAAVLARVLTLPGATKPLPILSPASNNEQREQYRANGKVEYPYASLIISNIAKNHTNNYNDALRRSGINRSNDNGTYTNYRLIPINYTMAFRYNAQSIEDIIHVARRWMHAEKTITVYD